MSDCFYPSGETHAGKCSAFPTVWVAIEAKDNVVWEKPVIVVFRYSPNDPVGSYTTVSEHPIANTCQRVGEKRRSFFDWQLFQLLCDLTTL